MRFWTTVMGQRLEDAHNTRSMLLCAEMLRRGHEVTMWTSAYDHIAKEWRTEYLESGGRPWVRADGLVVRFMKGCGYRRNIGPQRFADHWLAARDFLRQAGSCPRPDAIVASIPDHFTAASAVKFGRRVGASVIVDVRDKWPDVFFDAAPSGVARSVARIVLCGETARARRALKGAQAILGMMKSMRDWGVALAGRPAGSDDRIFYLTTSPKNFDLDLLQAQPTAAVVPVIDAVRGRTVFTFVGTFNRTQHPLLLIDALDLLASDPRYKPQELAFIIGGDGIGADELRARAAAHANVWLPGWLNSEMIAGVLRASDVGMLLTNFPTPAFNNKAFSYIASGLPIINCATGDLAELVEQEGVGLNVMGGSPASVAEAILALASDPEQRSAQAARMRALFNMRFERESNYSAYADHIEMLAGRT